MSLRYSYSITFRGFVYRDAECDSIQDTISAVVDNFDATMSDNVTITDMGVDIHENPEPLSTSNLGR